MNKREKIISNYVAGNDKFIIDKTVANFDENIKFTSIINGEITLLIKGLSLFEKHVKTSRNGFKILSQKIKSFKHNRGETEIEIESLAISALDFYNVQKNRNEVVLQTRSIFKFEGHKIVEVIDIS